MKNQIEDNDKAMHEVALAVVNTSDFNKDKALLSLLKALYIEDGAICLDKEINGADFVDIIQEVFVKAGLWSKIKEITLAD